MIKLVVLDVDGTSLDRDNQFYDDDIKEIDFYKKKGIEFMFASGRDMNMMLDMIEKSHVDGDLIINNGTQYRNIEGTKNIAHPMDEDAFRKMIPILQKYNYTGLTALKESSRLMKGNKWTLFKLEFSFFGWMILAGLVSGVVAMFVETIMPIPFLATFITVVVSTFFSAYFYDVKLNTCLAVFYEELDYADKNSVEL